MIHPIRKIIILIKVTSFISKGLILIKSLFIHIIIFINCDGLKTSLPVSHLSHESYAHPLNFLGECHVFHVLDHYCLIGFSSIIMTDDHIYILKHYQLLLELLDMLFLVLCRIWLSVYILLYVSVSHNLPHHSLVKMRFLILSSGFPNGHFHLK